MQTNRRRLLISTWQKATSHQLWASIEKLGAKQGLEKEEKDIPSSDKAHTLNV